MKFAIGWICLWLNVGIITTQGNPLELSDTNGFDNSVDSITGNDVIGSETFESDLNSTQDGNDSPSTNFHRIPAPVVQTFPTGDETESQPDAQSAGSVNSIQLLNQSASVDAAESTTAGPTAETENGTDPNDKRVFGIRDPLLWVKLRKALTRTTTTTAAALPTKKTTPIAKPISTSAPDKSNTSGRADVTINVAQTTGYNGTLSGNDSSHENGTMNRHGLVTERIETTEYEGNLLCGYPPICDQQRCQGLYLTGDSLEKCEVPGAKGGFIFAIVLASLAIIIGNSMLPILVWRNRDMRAPHNYMKVSLAAADAVIGFLLLFSVVPNVVQTMQSTELELARSILATENSPKAIVAGSMLTLSAQASLFHLTYLSIERFVAIRWPLWHRFKAQGSLSLSIVLIWILSIVAAFLPAAFPASFTYKYIPSLYVYILTSSSPDYVTLGTIYMGVTMLIPFILSVILTAATGIVVWRKMKNTNMKRYSTRNSRWAKNSSAGNGSSARSKNRSKSDSDLSERELKPEVAVFKTTVIMIAAFCLTLAPFIAVALLYYAEYYDCMTYSVPYAGAFYACLSNSFINVLIYTVRDRKFRKSWKKILKLTKNRSWSTGTWKTQKTKSSTCTGSVQMSPRPGRYNKDKETTKDTWTTDRETSKEIWERSLVEK